MDVMISPRLMPGIQIGDAWIQVEPTERTNRTGKPYWRTVIDIPGQPEYDETDLCGWGNASEMLCTLCAFLSACAESRDYGDGENNDLFPDYIGEWAQANADEITTASMEEEDE